MKKDIHLETHPVIFRDTEAGVDFVSRSTMKSDNKEKVGDVDHYVIEVEISSASHPFYTGKKRILDTTGRVEKFKKRVLKSKQNK